MSDFLSLFCVGLVGGVVALVCAPLFLRLFGLKLVKNELQHQAPSGLHTAPSSLVPPPPFPLSTGGTVVPGIGSRSAPPAPRPAPLSQLRVELFIGSDPIPLTYTSGLPAADLVSARPTTMDDSISAYSRETDAPVERLPPFSKDDFLSGGVVMVGRKGHVRPALPGFDGMSVTLFEIGVQGGVFVITAHKRMRETNLLQVRSHQGDQVMHSRDLNMPVNGVIEIRQQAPRTGRAEISTWYFKISLCN